MWGGESLFAAAEIPQKGRIWTLFSIALTLERLDSEVEFKRKEASSPPPLLLPEHQRVCGLYRPRQLQELCLRRRVPADHPEEEGALVVRAGGNGALELVQPGKKKNQVSYSLLFYKKVFSSSEYKVNFNFPSMATFEYFNSDTHRSLTFPLRCYSMKNKKK